MYNIPQWVSVVKMWFPLYAICFIHLNLVSKSQYKDVISTHSGLIVPFVSPSVKYSRRWIFNFPIWVVSFSFWPEMILFIPINECVCVLMMISSLCSVFLDCRQTGKCLALLERMAKGPDTIDGFFFLFKSFRQSVIIWQRDRSLLLI